MDELENKSNGKGGRSRPLLPTLYRQEVVKQRVLEMYFDASDGKFRTYEGIAEEMGVSAAMVWRILRDVTKDDLDNIVPLWATNLAVRERVHSEVPALINRMINIGKGNINAPVSVQLKAIETLLGLAGVSEETMKQRTDEGIPNNAIMVSVTVGGAPQQEFIDTTYSEIVD